MTQLLLSDCSIVRHFLIHSQQQLQLHAPSIMREFCSVVVVVFWFLRLFVRISTAHDAVACSSGHLPPFVLALHWSRHPSTRRHDSNSISRPFDDFTRASSFWRRKKKKPKQKNFLFWTGMESINSRVCTISKCFVVLGSQRMPTLADIRAAGGLASRFGAHRNGNRRRWVFLLNNNNIFITWSL